MADNVQFPIQPVHTDDRGTPRFVCNRIVEFLLDNGGYDMNDIARLSRERGWTNEEREQFAQLIGYSIRGAGDLGYVSDRVWDEAWAAYEAVTGA